MTASVQLDKYLHSFGKRLKQVCLVRGSAVLAAVFLIVCVVFAWFAIDTGFTGTVVNAGRLALLASIAAIVYLLIIRPIKRLDNDDAMDIERRTPAFAGRVITYREMQDRGNPFRELLAEDALQISDDYPVEHQVQNREFTLPGVIAGSCVALLLGLLIAGPGLMNYSLRNLLAGWALPGLLPPQSIDVSPGNELVRRGGNVRISAVMAGFNPDQAQVHVKIGDKDWQTVAMVRRNKNFEFTFFSVREPMQYYVATTGIRSPAYDIKVVELPDVRDLKLTYHYPDWTKRDPETIDHGGDIRTVQGTNVDLEVITDKPLPAGLLVLNGDNKPLSVKGESARTRFQITKDGQYFIAAQLGNEQVRLTDDYFIKVVEDGKPEVRLLRPGRDWNASNIEEVTAQVEAKDDYGLDSLQLHYSINGGDWQTVPFQVKGRNASKDYVFFLENMHSGNKETGEKPLVPGDIIAYYAQATDRKNTTQTDMFFIQVQSFERRYSQSQQMGGGGGGQQNPQQEISQRQKEIIVSTWNLLRKQTGKQTAEDGGRTIKDNSGLLSELQETLAKQAKTLADRTRARELTSADARIKTFVENMEQASKAMHPAAEKLAATELQAAIQPEQEALQHLLRAESTFNDIQLSFQRGQRGGGGGLSAGRDLSEMFNLEMDLEKNQYETGSSASRESASKQVDDAMQKLQELARRQQQLANDFRQQRQLSDAQRWQQDMLRREAEKLQRQLQDMQGQQAAGGQAGAGQAGSSGQSAQGGSAGNELNRRLNSAIRAMKEASDAMRGNQNSEQLQRAVQEAQRQLQRARQQVAENQQQSMQKAFQDMADRASALSRQQDRIDKTLKQALREAVASQKDGEDSLTNPLTYNEEIELADRKRAMSDDLQSLRQKMQASAKKFRDMSPAAVRELDRANTDLTNTEIDSRLNITANYIEQGGALWVATSESIITDTIKNLKNRLDHAESLALNSDRPGQSDLDRALAQTRQLRRELQQLTSGGNNQDRANSGNSQQQNQANGNSQQPGQATGNSGQQGQANNANGGQATGGNIAGGRLGGNYGGGSWNSWRRPYGVISPDYQARINRDINTTANAINPVVPELRQQGLTDAQIDEIYRLLRELTNTPMNDQRNDAILQQEMNKRLALLEQLEMRLDQAANKEQPGKLRSAASEPVPAEYKDAVAEYYRRLSKD